MNMTVAYAYGHEQRKQRRGRRPRYSHLHVSVKADDKARNVLEMMAERWSHEVKAYRASLPAIYEMLGLASTTKARWSQYAGCSCPCSPGFILDIRDGKDYFAAIQFAE